MIREYKPALIFMVKYIVVYLILNTAYSFFISSFYPGPDPVTIAVSTQSASILDFFYSSVNVLVNPKSEHVGVYLNNQSIVEVYEGCNSLNVMIVFLAFMVAFTGPLKKWMIFSAVGLVCIYLVNLLRVSGLFVVSLNFPNAVYFYHKFVFTGAIYAFVFALWYFWVQSVKKWSPETT